MEKQAEEKPRHQQTSRCYQTGTLHQLLCDRYFVGYHTTAQKLLVLVEKELTEC